MECKKQISIINIILTIMLVLSFVIGILVIIISKYETKVERLAQNSDYVKKNYTTSEVVNSNTWDISKNGDGSITAFLSDDGILTISGEGEMKDWTSEDTCDWHSEYNKRNVQKVIINEGITNIGNRAFEWCNSLTNIEIPGTVISIGELAFEMCAFSQIELPEGLKHIGDGAFWGAGLESIKIPSSVKKIEENTFYYCHNLKNIEILKGVTHIGESAFFDCNSLTNIKIPNSVIYRKYCIFKL